MRRATSFASLPVQVRMAVVSSGSKLLTRFSV